ncbi:MAG: CRISPR-associated endonuclease Cas2 [Verrucomicrobiales bacterium]|jgi:CRISPR-associated protein Cas2|nr:CRISPR-associated endonuclease Cas2 [Verrucomicrobiales bacterium]
MWLMAMLDLPTDTDVARRRYTKFREALLDDGFVMIHFSVYARHCISYKNLEVHEKRVKSTIPEDGEVRLFRFTDRQFQKQLVFYGKLRKATEKTPEQLIFF